MKPEVLYTVKYSVLNKIVLSLFGGLSLAVSVFFIISSKAGPIKLRVPGGVMFAVCGIYLVMYAFRTIKVYTNDTIELRRFLFFKRTYALSDFKRVKVRKQMSLLEDSLEEFTYYKFYSKDGRCVFVIESEAVNARRLFMAITARGTKIVK